MPARNSFTWPLSAFDCSASWLAAASMVLAESPDSAAAAVTSVMLAETSLVLAEASWTLREISSVAEVCSSTEAAMPLAMPWTSSMVKSEEHTSELQSLMRISYAVFCLKKKKNKKQTQTTIATEHYTRH